MFSFIQEIKTKQKIQKQSKEREHKNRVQEIETSNKEMEAIVAAIKSEARNNFKGLYTEKEERDHEVENKFICPFPQVITTEENLDLEWVIIEEEVLDSI